MCHSKEHLKNKKTVLKIRKLLYQNFLLEFPQSIKMYAPCHSWAPNALWELNVQQKKTHQLLGECRW